MLLLSTDDWGVFEATPKVLKGQCYPLQDATKATGSKGSIESMNAEFSKQGIVKFWHEGDRAFGQFVKFSKYNELDYQREPEFSCPPWLLENGIDTRLSPSKKRVYERIESATRRLEADGDTATYRNIAMVAKCSQRDVSSYCKHKEKISCYQILPSATNATVDLDYDLDLESEKECTPLPPKKRQSKKQDSLSEGLIEILIEHYNEIYGRQAKPSKTNAQILNNFVRQLVKRFPEWSPFETCIHLITATKLIWNIPELSLLNIFRYQQNKDGDKLLDRIQTIEQMLSGDYKRKQKAETKCDYNVPLTEPSDD